MVVKTADGALGSSSGIGDSCGVRIWKGGQKNDICLREFPLSSGIFILIKRKAEPNKWPCLC